MFSTPHVSSASQALKPVSAVYKGRRMDNGLLEEESLSEQFLQFIDEDSFPCVGAKAALARNEIHVHEFGSMNEPDSTADLLDQLGEFVEMMDFSAGDTSKVHSFVAIFNEPVIEDELHFENLLWTQLYSLHLLDVHRGAEAATDISSNPDSPQFSLSLAGHPFFVIGLHPESSRLARQFKRPVLVFNSHRQFERLREDGRYQKMQKATRKRDVALQGSINPNLADFGINSEARQYSGREVGPEWKCPYDFERAR